MAGSAFGAIAREWEPKTISVYRAAVGTNAYCLADAKFPVEDGLVMLPDVLGRQLDLARVGRHPEVKAFRVTEDGEVAIETYGGHVLDKGDDVPSAPAPPPVGPPADPPPADQPPAESGAGEGQDAPAPPDAAPDVAPAAPPAPPPPAPPAEVKPPDALKDPKPSAPRSGRGR
jgi:hypothetical protein